MAPMLERLDDLLDATRDALLAGDLAALTGLGDRVAAEVDRLPVLDARDANRLRFKAERNARLLQAAGRGLRAARDRMAEITSGPSLTTYDKEGRKARLAGPMQALGRF
jgi:hypothetical protein